MYLQLGRGRAVVFLSTDRSDRRKLDAGAERRYAVLRRCLHHERVPGTVWDSHACVHGPSKRPDTLPDTNSVFLPGARIGTFTAVVPAAVRVVHATAKFEVLYPPDTNDAVLTQERLSCSSGDWTPANLACLKTENFTYTGNRDLDQVRRSVQLPATLGFRRRRRATWVGIGDYTTPWSKEWSSRYGRGSRIHRPVRARPILSHRYSLPSL